MATNFLKRLWGVSHQNLAPLRFLVGGMSVKRPSWGKLTELVTNHVLRSEHWDELFSVMDRERQPNHLRRDHRATAPCFDGTAVTGFQGLRNLLAEALVNEWSFFN
jgi:hypothetical protein